MAASYLVGVDLGGTKILTALADETGNVLTEIKVATEAAGGYAHVIDRLVDTIRQVREQAGVSAEAIKGVAVGSPGPLSAESGVVHFAPNLGWRDVPIKKLLIERLKTRVFIDNDANLAAFGEFVYGAGQGVAHMVYFTVSTGVGGGLILDGRLYHGIGDGAGELGHMQIMPDGPLCACGAKGCLEALASGTAIARMAKELVTNGKGQGILEQAKGKADDISAVTVATAAAAGDQEAKKIIAQAAGYLGIGVAGVINIFNPELVVFGGGVMEIGEPIWREIRREVAARAFHSSGKQANLVPAKLGQRAGVLGAVALCREKVAEMQFPNG